MALRLFDTKTRTTRPFTPLAEGRVGVYVCGATVQAAPHLGHLRAAVVFDQLRRWLTFKGYAVTFVRNVTDIDDKILVKSREEGRPWWEHAYLYEQRFTQAYDALGIARPSYEPRATGHVTEMVTLIERLIGAGHAYPAPDGSGDVYFDAVSWPDYGELTRQRLADMEPAGDAEPRGKRDPRDFALWKGHKDGDPETASWPTPWGRGRPGWHLECSAMATKYLGASFDIHGGGLDLRFPHHENELAQSRAAGDGFAQTWMHSGLLNIGGEKMSKSLGNSIFFEDLVAESGALALRYALSSAHYRSALDYTPGETLERAEPVVGRFTRFLESAREQLGEDAPDLFTLRSGYAGAPELPAAFVDAMDEDLGVPQALAALFDALTRGNALLAAADVDRAALRESAAQVQVMLNVLGVDPLDPEGPGGTVEESADHAALAALVAALVEQRAHARAEKDYAAADAVRDLIAGAGIELIDTAHDTRFRIKE